MPRIQLNFCDKGFENIMKILIWFCINQMGDYFVCDLIENWGGQDLLAFEEANNYAVAC